MNASTIFTVLFGILFIATFMVIPISVINSTVTIMNGPAPPTGNELAVPVESSLLGDDDLYTQRVCPSITLPLLARATTERTISNTYFKQTSARPDPRRLNALIWGYFQFTDHDIVLSVTDKSVPTSMLEMLPASGVFITLSRVQTRVVSDKKETLNQITGAIDASTVYGDYKNPEKLRLLRDNNGESCHLIEGPGRTPKYVPSTNEFYCGDERCTEHVLLSSLHALFLREHNRWCTHLQSTTSWTNEQLFWKARSLTIAVLQHITYAEALPALFGSQHYLLDISRNTQNKGTYTRITTEFAAAAYRFGHSMVANTLGELELRDLFFDANLTISLGVDGILGRGLKQHAETADIAVVDGLRDFLFSPNDHMTVSEDLVVRNLYRGRDIMLPSYRDICTCYGTTPINSVGAERDPMVGLLSEPLVSGSSLPHTIAVIVAEQFRRLRDNDPTFYTKPSAQLTSSELYVIRRTTLKDVILRNTELSPESVQDRAFFL